MVRGAIEASDNLTINAPDIVAATFATTQAAARETISATNGDLVFNSAGNSSATLPVEGLGAALTLAGQTVILDGAALLPSGSIQVHATNGNVVVGGTLSAAGTTQTFGSVNEYTSGGQITLSADAGNVTLASGAAWPTFRRPPPGATPAP